jgi:DNA-binding transcriptional LysR family regulator
MDTLLSMKVLCQVVESGSFVTAAERLNLSTAMTSKHVMSLERRLGTRLLNRTSRHLSLTEAGTVYYDQCREILDRLEVAEAAVSRSTVAASGILKISAPAWFANPLFAKVLMEYHDRYPDVLLDLKLSDRMVNLVEEGFDLALRVRHNPIDTVLARRICRIQFMLVGSPEYLRAHRHPTTHSELSQHIFIAYTHKPFGEGAFFDDLAIKLETLKLTVSIRCDNTAMLHQAVLASMGLAFLPEWLIVDDLTSGRLEIVQLDCTLPDALLDAVYTSRRYLLPRVRTFIDFLSDRFADSTGSIGK